MSRTNGTNGSPPTTETMTSPLPLRPAVDHTPRGRDVLALSDDRATDAIEVLGCATARSILGALADDPATASDLAEHVDTSIQNVHYHLGNLRDADLIASVDTWYSAKGTEMTVYAPTHERLEIHLAVEVDGSPSEPERPHAGPPEDRPDDPRRPAAESEGPLLHARE